MTVNMVRIRAALKGGDCKSESAVRAWDCPGEHNTTATFTRARRAARQANRHNRQADRVWLGAG